MKFQNKGSSSATNAPLSKTDLKVVLTNSSELTLYQDCAFTSEVSKRFKGLTKAYQRHERSVLIEMFYWDDRIETLHVFENISNIYEHVFE